MKQAISIVIPTHNRPDFLLKAVESALENCSAQGEVIVVDDRSQIPAATLLMPLQDPRLKIIRNKNQHGGAAYARNLGAQHAHHEIVMFLDDDDTFFEGYIEALLNSAELAQADYGYGQISFTKKEILSKPKEKFTLLTDNKKFRQYLSGTNGGYWVRRSTFLALGGFDTAQTVDEDTDLCVRFISAGAKCLVYHGLATLVFHSNVSVPDQKITQLSFDTKAQTVLSCYKRTYEKAAPQFSPSSEAAWYLTSRYVRRAVRAGAQREALAFCLAQHSAILKLRLLAFYHKKRISQVLRKTFASLKRQTN
ncbi:glycosyltransferase family 2 protein [Thiolinea disciformis]|uniref:glycosyltransferase family 2 protein n=1 Tax=Thiolinea disciformis TaxID=125614 RepID=UPI00037A9DDE|nr:glycosyltransferase family A protein [Thiolinea disciformis]